jgi:hypothetical protein
MQAYPAPLVTSCPIIKHRCSVLRLVYGLYATYIYKHIGVYRSHYDYQQSNH